jgi:hypothetical protein
MVRLLLRRPYTPPDAENWTDFGEAPLTGTIFYVSSSLGDDGNDGLTPETAFETVAAGYAALTTGQDDWLLLKRGDVFPSGSMGSAWHKYGPSGTWGSNGYMRLGAYGMGNRPEVQDTTVSLGLGFGSSANAVNVAFTDIYFHDAARWTAGTSSADRSGVTFTGGGWAGTGFIAQYYLFENCHWRGFSWAMIVGEAAFSDIRIRRCRAFELFQVGTDNISAFYIAAFGPVEMEDVLIWRHQSPATPGTWGGLTHGVYMQATSDTDSHEMYSTVGVVAIDCADVIMQRSGGVYRRNLSAACRIPGTYGQAYSGTPTPGGVTANLTDSVWIDPLGADTGSSFFVGNMSGGTVARNMAIRSAATSLDWDLNLTAQNGANIGVQGVTFEDNWISGQIAGTGGTGVSGNTYTDNDESNGAVSWTIADIIDDIEAEYSVSIGSSWDDVAEHLLTADRGSWATHHTSTAWINAMRARESLAAITDNPM